MLNRRRFLSASVALGAAIALPYRAHAQQPVSMKIGTSTLNDVQHQWMIEFQRLAQEQSDGGLRVEIFPASQLGSTTRMIEQTQLNAMQCVIAPPEFMGGIDGRFQVLSAPALFEDLRHVTRTLNDAPFNEFVLSLGADRGLKGLGLFISGPTAFVAREPITTPDGFYGKRVRVLAAELQMAQIRKLGGTPLPMPPSEVLPALQQGTLDAVMSCVPVFEGLSYMDGAPHLLETNHGIIASTAMLSQDWFEELPDELREIVVAAGREATEAVTQYSYDDVGESRTQWEAKGGKIVPLTDAQRAAFVDTLLPTGPEAVEANPELAEAYELMTSAIERTRTA